MEQGACDLTGAERRQRFERYLRTGRRTDAKIEYKFNPYHDPLNGQFTFAPGGGDTANGSSRSGGQQRSRSAADDLPGIRAASVGRGSRSQRGSADVDGMENPAIRRDRIQLAQYRPNPRARRGGNSGAFRDPMTLHQVFPGLETAPGGAIIALADDMFDLSGPGNRLTAELMEAQQAQIIRQIKEIDPAYYHQSLAKPETVAGQSGSLDTVRFDRAATLYRVRNDIDALQVETLRFAQARVDRAYDKALQEFQAGRLEINLSREEAIGNFVDRAVRRDLRDQYDRYGIARSKGEPVRVIGREYDTSGTDRTYRIPDARVGDVAYDVTLTRKTLATKQVRGFFGADFRPRIVVIIRPSQLGVGSSYVINRKGK